MTELDDRSRELRDNLAVVRAQGVSGLTPATLGDSSQLQVGHPLHQQGHRGLAPHLYESRTEAVAASKEDLD